MGRVHSINRPHSLSIPDGRWYRFAQSAYSWDFSLLCIYESCVGSNGSFRNWLWRFQLSLLWGGAVVGLLAMFYPQVCGNGKGLVTSLFHQNWDFYTVLFLVIVKLIATSVTFGSGAVGGVFTPTLFIGSAVGVLYGQAVLYFAPQLHPDPTMYGLMGMGSFLAATTGAPLMAILMVFELTLSYVIVPFLMVACVLGYYCSSLFERRFMYGESLERKGAAFFKSQLAEVDLADLIKRDPLTLPQNATFAQIAQTFVQHQFQHIYIVDGQRKLLGAVSLHQVKAFLDRPELETVVIAGDIMDENFPSISLLHSTGDSLKRFSETRSERLPVVDNPTLQRLIGSISKTDIILHLAGEQSRADSCDHTVEAGCTSCNELASARR